MLRPWVGVHSSSSSTTTNPCCFITTFPSSSSSSSSSSSASQIRVSMAAASSIRIGIVGDVPDLVLFTGDFGNENVELVKSVSELKLPKAVILGNHDCWTTQQFSQKKKDRVQLQLECLGEEHVGYRRLDFPNLKLSVVGGRPFSHGGNRIFREKLLSSRYGVQDMNGSAKKICKASVGTPEGHSIVLLAHNGPTGLGSEKNDICGRDWVHQGGDHGDPDLEQAISNMKETTKFPIPLVVFGHMHKELASRNGRLRKMIVVGADNTIYLNGAIVPRVKKLFHEQQTGTGSSSTEGAPVSLALEPSGTVRGFTLVEINDGKLDKIAETWVSIIGDEIKIEEELILFQSGMRASSL
ncbi:uncharacterized protein LOC113322913 isoform X2 [Papaver somniferum]|uniref:uncharacterized protein LOC113322913 isoform X2 n=1 Tax=Papaver somniferum TaxID=3469 RepID=UPI000E7013A4|nr:uncharacterized protein LOC113322913 isoform X2 [Papaver somniferum]